MEFRQLYLYLRLNPGKSDSVAQPLPPSPPHNDRCGNVRGIIRKEGRLREAVCPLNIHKTGFSLSLDTTGAVAACQLLHFCYGDHVVVAADGVLQSGCSNCERNSCLGVLAGQTKLVAVAGDLKDESVICKVETFNEAYRLKEEGAILNWFDIEEKEGFLSLNDKMGTVLQTPAGQQLFASMFGKMMGGSGEGGHS